MKLIILNLDFQEFTSKGFMLGHASVVSIPKDFSMTEYIHHLFEFLLKSLVVNVFQEDLVLTEVKKCLIKLRRKLQKFLLNY